MVNVKTLMFASGVFCALVFPVVLSADEYDAKNDVSRGIPNERLHSVSSSTVFQPKPFIQANQGQLKGTDIKYFVNQQTFDVGFAKGRVYFHSHIWTDNGEKKDIRNGGNVFFVEFGGTDVVPVAEEPLDGYSNYFLGNNSANWLKHIPHYNRIRYKDIYPKIDLVYFFDEKGGMTYEFYVHPGGDPRQIELSYKYVDGVAIEEEDVSKVLTATGQLKDGKLSCYQKVDGKKSFIRSKFIRTASASYSVSLIDDYDKSKLLIVDPTIVFTSYWGVGGGNNRTVQIDKQGNIYMSGGSSSINWPTTLGAYDRTHSGNNWPDITVAKFDQNGKLLWSTLLGGSFEDYAYVSAVGPNGELYIAGRAGDGFPTTSGAFDRTFNGGKFQGNVHSPTDAFVAKLSSDGSQLLYGTYIGGNGNDNGRAIHLLPTGELLVGGGNSDSKNLPTTLGAYRTTHAGAHEAWVAKVSADGSNLKFLTYFGATNDTKGDETIRALGVDLSGNIWIGGSTEGTNVSSPTANAFQAVRGRLADSYIAKLSSDGKKLVYFSWLGGNGFDEIETEGVSDVNGNFYVAGSTKSTDFPTTTGAVQSVLKGGWDGFVMKVNNDGSLGFSSLFGGGILTGPEAFFGPGVDSKGNVYAAGRFNCNDCLMTPNAFQVQNPSAKTGFKSGLLAVFSPDGRKLLYSTFIGGSNEDHCRYLAVAPDSSSVVVIGETRSTDIPQINSPQATASGAFFAKFDISDIIGGGSDTNPPAVPQNLSVK